MVFMCGAKDATIILLVFCVDDFQKLFCFVCKTVCLFVDVVLLSQMWVGVVY